LALIPLEGKTQKFSHKRTTGGTKLSDKWLVFLLNLAYTMAGMISATVWDTVLGKICDIVLGKIGDYVVSKQAKEWKTIPNKNFTAFNSRRLNMEEIIRALKK